MTQAGASWIGDDAGPLLRTPPFPGAEAPPIAFSVDPAPRSIGTAGIGAALEAIRKARVGGTFWAAQPNFDGVRALVARPTNIDQAQAMLARATAEGVRDQLVLWLPSTSVAALLDLAGAPVIIGPCDPWHLIDKATTLWLDSDDSVALLARMADRPVSIWGQGRFAALADGDVAMVERVATEQLLRCVQYRCPFTGRDADLAETIDLLDYWRRLIDANRPIALGAGFARWKREMVAPLLWNGSDPVRFVAATAEALADVASDQAVAMWKSRVSPAFLDAVDASGLAVHEVEDGFIRSSGLGANCVPPLSIAVDRLGVHFDPQGPSELERILEEDDFSPDLLDRAERLQRTILASGISKYGVAHKAVARPAGSRRHVLVTGQVEDDRSVLTGGAHVGGNLGLMQRARAEEPDAFIIYKPHPDILAGHRKGAVPETQAAEYVDLIIEDAPISAVLDMVDSVHVMTSLAGFEALIRGKAVTTHGVPFYAGWGLTRDLGIVPARRTRHRSIVELIAAVLLVYPRYVDPMTRLPCPPEILIERLVAGVRRQSWPTVTFRRLQGAVMRRISRVAAA